MDELKTQEIKRTLDKVCKSQSFVNSGRNIRLLKFLVQKALDGEFVKEQVVGFELFNKGYNPDERNSKVRVYMYKLRQKLDEYNAEAGKTDSIRFEIKKGQYNLEFIEPGEIGKSTLSWWKITAPIVIIMGIAAVFIFKAQKPENLWTSFFNSPNETICFISDHYIVSKRIKDKLYFTHILAVNDETDFNEYKNQTNDTTYKPQSFSYVSKMAPIAVNSLSKIFTKNHSEFTVELDSEFKYDDLKNKNLIFVGQYSTLHQSETLFLDNSKVFINKGGSIHYHSGNDTIKYFNNTKTERTRDYAMVSYRKMDNGNSVLFFASNHDIGVIATVHNFTNKNWLKNLYAQFPKDTKSFNALFKVTGLKRTELDCHLVQIEYVQQ